MENKKIDITVVLIIVAVVAITSGVIGRLSAQKTSTTQTATIQPTIQTQQQVSASIAQQPVLAESVEQSLSIEEANKDICLQLFPHAKSSEDSIKIGDSLCKIDKHSGDYATGIITSVMELNPVAGLGAHWLGVKIGEKWAFVQETQDGFYCELLEKYNVPKDFVGCDYVCETSNIQHDFCY